MAWWLATIAVLLAAPAAVIFARTMVLRQNKRLGYDRFRDVRPRPLGPLTCGVLWLLLAPPVGMAALVAWLAVSDAQQLARLGADPTQFVWMLLATYFYSGPGAFAGGVVTGLLSRLIARKTTLVAVSAVIGALAATYLVTLGPIFFALGALGGLACGLVMAFFRRTFRAL